MKKHNELRDLITSRLDRLFEVYQDMEDDSDLWTEIGVFQGTIRNEWSAAQQFIDHYDKTSLQAICVNMVNLLAQWHELSDRYAHIFCQIEGKENAIAYWLGGHQTHELLGYLSSQLKINEGEKCWPPGSDC